MSDNIRKILTPILRNNFNPEGLGLMTITNVEMSSDLRLAKICVSFINNKKSVHTFVDELNSKIKFFKYQVAQKWHAKFMPDLEFFYDDSLRKAEKITKLMQNIND